ncbi:MAG TPA: hypothetical protein PLT26_14860 [Anaerolineaceae bacterium]|nr:hypothetical protein [Anaerolineaceae bacterium]
MKTNFLAGIKNIIWLLLLCLSGCTIFGTRVLPAPTHVSPTSTVATNVEPISLSLSGKIAFISEGSNPNDHRLMILQLENGSIVDITPPELPLISNLSWSPDGQYIAFDAVKDNVIQIFTINADATQLTQLTTGENDAFRPSWSPDGENILFISTQANNSGSNDSSPQQLDLYMMEPDGTDMHRFAIESQSDHTSVSGYYRADGLIAVYEPGTRFSVNNYVVNSNGVVQTQFPEFTTNAPIAWSPDGERAIYTADRTTSSCAGFWVSNVNDSAVSCLGIEHANELQPDGKIIGADGASWSPDGNYILFVSNLDGDSDLYVIKPDGTELSQITNLLGNEGSAVWWINP